jgi:hypothetical protein
MALEYNIHPIHCYRNIGLLKLAVYAVHATYRHRRTFLTKNREFYRLAPDRVDWQAMSKLGKVPV